MKKKIFTAALLLSLMLALTGCGGEHMLMMTLEAEAGDDVEIAVSVLDKNGKFMGGGNLCSDGGELMVSVPNGSYTISIDDVIYEGDGVYAPTEDLTVQVKGDTTFCILMEKIK